MVTFFLTKPTGIYVILQIQYNLGTQFYLFMDKKYTDMNIHSTKKPVTTMLTYPWKCTVLHCNHLGNTWKPLVLITRHFDYYRSASEGDNQSVRSSAPVVSRCFPGGYNVKLYISRGRLAWWLLAFLHSEHCYSTALKLHTLYQSILFVGWSLRHIDTYLRLLPDWRIW